MEIVLASSSPSRQKLLKSIGLSFEVIPHRVDEKVYQDKIKDVKLLCQTLAKEKAQSIDKKNAFIIGVDQMVSLQNRVFGKPMTHAKAVETLQALQGKTHELVSGMCLKRPDGSYFENLIINQLSMRPLTLKQIEYYLKQDKPYECAGAYKIESLGISLFTKIESPDFSAIEGLPLISLCNQLKIF